MKQFKDIKVGTKLVGLVAIMGVLLLASVFIAMNNVSQVNDAYQKIQQEDDYAGQLGVSIGKAFSEDRASLTRYLFRVNPAERQQIAQEIQQQDAQIDARLQELAPFMLSDEAKAIQADIQKNMSAYRQARAALMAAQPAPGQPVDNLPELKSVHDLGAQLGKDFDRIGELGIKGAAESSQALGEQIAQQRMLVFGLSLAVIVVAVLLGYQLARRVSTSIQTLAARAEAIAGGNISQPVPVTSADEIGQLAEHLEAMRQQLQQMMSEMRTAADQVAAGARNVSDASVSLSQGATEQAASIEELSTSISAISSQTASNAAHATQANELAAKARQQAQAGDADMQAMLTAMDAINVSSTNISKIIKVIDEIAFQTNILALNAAVEAARAGQHGKGFAVVAEEVRNLAARSAKAAKETTDMIEDSIGKVGHGREIAAQTAESLKLINEHVTQVADIVDAIAKASGEQKFALEQIDQGVSQVSQVVQANSATSEEAAAASQQLSAQAEHLQETSAKFLWSER